MKNKMTDLRNHMFAALERLNNEELSEEELKKEIQRATAISEVGKVIVDSAKTQVMAMRTLMRKGELQESDIDEDVKGFLQRPKAEYSNTSPLKIANTGS